ncbi:HTH domain-containing protein [Nonomuraea sp. NPDC049400]|uniref:HTH domain-containing protein n=1 Tax=Nonomuraea sp. NPDC049400 TaxID=3364352 RepID=UPI003796BBC9
MPKTSARLLALLSLLQVRGGWPEALLAEGLDISPRTVRRDVNRLHGTPPVSATPGKIRRWAWGAAAVSRRSSGPGASSSARATPRSRLLTDERRRPVGGRSPTISAVSCRPATAWPGPTGARTYSA